MSQAEKGGLSHRLTRYPQDRSGRLRWRRARGLRDELRHGGERPADGRQDPNGLADTLERWGRLLAMVGERSLGNRHWRDPISTTRPDIRSHSHGFNGFPGQSISLFYATLTTLACRLGLPAWTYDHNFDAMKTAIWCLIREIDVIHDRNTHAVTCKVVSD